MQLIRYTKLKESKGSEIFENIFLTLMMGTICFGNLFWLKDMHIGVKQKSKLYKKTKPHLYSTKN